MSTSGWFAGFLVATVAVADSSAQPSMRELPGHTTEATIVIDAAPDQVYALVTDYANWQRVFSDIESVTVKSGGRDNAKVRFRSRAIDHKVTVQFANVPGRVIRFKGIAGPPGGEAAGEYILTPVDHGTRTHVTARLMMDVDGVASLFVSDKKIRRIRQTKLRADLTDVERYFQRSRRVAR